MNNEGANLSRIQNEKKSKEEPLDKKENNKTYYQQRCEATGLTPELNKLSLPKYHGIKNNREVVDFPLLEEDKRNGNILIPLYYLDGKPVNIYKENPGKLQNGKEKPLYITRYRPGNERITSDGTKIKYDIPKGEKAMPWISPGIIYAHLNNQKINTLIITEGYIKAMSGYANGLYIIGLSGIQNSKDKNTGTLYADIISVIKDCHVKNIVLLYDGECCDISLTALEEEKDLYIRPNSFYTSLKNLKELMKDHQQELNFDLYFACVNTPGIKDRPKGLDDLFEAVPEEKNNIVKELCSFSQIKLTFFTRINITDGINKVYEFLKLKTVEDFYSFHQESLQDIVFVFKANSYQFNSESQKVVKQGSTQKEIELKSFEKNQFFERNNEYYIIVQGKGFTKELKISNFKINWIYTLNNDSDNTPILIELIQSDKPSIFLEITSVDLLNLQKFSAIVLKYGLNFNGTSYVFKNILTSLHSQSKEAKYITALGQSLENDFYCFFNGVLKSNGEFVFCNDHGVVELDNEWFYIPSGKKGNEKISNLDDEMRFKLTKGTMDLATFVEKIYNIYGINGLIGLCYTIAAIHRDLIFIETKYFPFLFLYGPKGSGKSTYINFFMSFFGEPQAETTEQSTDKAIERKFAQINNNLQYIKEFSPTFEGKIKNILKNAYDGVGYSRAQMSNDNKTKTSIVRSALAIDGNYFPTQDDALFSRLIFLLWQPTFTDETKGLTQQLQDSFKSGTGLIFTDIYKQRGVYKTGFTETYRSKINELKVLCRSKKIIFSEREISHIALMVAVFKISIGNILNQQAHDLFVDFLIKGSQKQVEIAHGIDDVNMFFAAIDTLHQQGKIIEQRYYVREANTSFDYLYINFNLCQAEYAKYIRETGEKLFITKEGLKQKLEFSCSKNYRYNKTGEVYFPKKFGAETQRCFVFEVDPYSFTLRTP